jgi:DNA repair photolyase
MEFKSFFKTVGGNEGNKCHYPTRLDTYGCGCQHDCKYCYAKSLLEFRNLWDAQNPSVADIEKVRKVIEKNLKRGDVIRLGGMTDCFMPLERKERVTYKTIDELNKRDVGYLIVTKSDIVADDEYMSLMRKDLAHIQVTVTCTDDAFCRSYEKAAPPSRRIVAIERLFSEGFDVQLRLSPYIPQFIEKGYLDIDRINSVRCDKILVEFLRVNRWISRWFDIDYSEYTAKAGGYHHMPIQKKLKYLKKITGFKELSVCEDLPFTFHYWERNINHNPKDCCNLRIINEK